VTGNRLVVFPYFSSISRTCTRYMQH